MSLIYTCMEMGRLSLTSHLPIPSPGPGFCFSFEGGRYMPLGRREHIIEGVAPHERWRWLPVPSGRDTAQEDSSEASAVATAPKKERATSSTNSVPAAPWTALGRWPLPQPRCPQESRDDPPKNL